MDPSQDAAPQPPTEAAATAVLEPSQTPTEADPGRAARRLPADLPASVGPYRVLRVLGEGGMGTVLECEQEQPLRRRVALKLIRAGMASAESVARFESERQALAQLSHPAIARVFDAGASEGRPYFVMELVAGQPITAFCDRLTLTVRERLTLFVKVCEGVQHAHQNGIIHRDLKPSNILVTDEDGRPAPKIIDFGIAKATRPGPEEAPYATLRGELMGTPEYMSPEQAEPSRLDVDTRTDVYSLGVILYELLVGAPPFAARAPGEGGLTLISRRLREAEPPRPSTRVSVLADGGRRTAQERRTDERGLARALRGDLDWIVLKAMERERERRYASVSELAADIQRHLDLQPVLAGPPSAVYRATKFVRRHRVAVAAGAVAVLGLVVAAAGTSVGLVRARAAERRALEEARTAEQVSEFLEGLFKVSDPSQARGDSLTARQILDRGAARVATELAGQPLVQARLMATVGRVYQELGDYARARELLEQALALRRAQLGPEHPEVAATLNDLARVFDDQGQVDRAEQLARQALALRERALGPDHPAVAETLNELGALARRRGELASARSLLERALAIREMALGPDDPALAGTLSNLALVAKSSGDFAAARPLLERALAIREKAFGPDHTEVANILNNLGTLQCQSGDCAPAQPLFERALAIREKALGPEHPWVAESLDNLASLHYSAGRYAAALPLYERALAIREKTLGPDHPRHAIGLANLGTLLAELGQYERARALLERALAIREKKYGPRHPDTAVTLDDLATLESEAGHAREAAALAARALAIVEKALGPDHPDTATALGTSAAVLYAAGDPAAARPLAERARAVAERSLGPDHADTARARLTLARVEFAQGERDQARALGEPALQALARAMGAGHPEVAFERASWAALEGDRAAALRWLGLAAERGFANPRQVTSSELRRFQGDPQLASILDGMRERGAAATAAR